MTPPHPDKPSLRRELRRERRDYVARMSQADRRRAFFVMPGVAAPLFADRPVVAGYAAIGDECDVAALLARIQALGCRIALPWFAARGAAMQFRLWNVDEPLAEAPFGGGQPHAQSPIVAPQLLLLPLVGFDRQGNRLGQGGGHYDRALERLPGAVSIGVGWSAQEAESLPADSWDVPLDHILTEREWITPMNEPKQ